MPIALIIGEDKADRKNRQQQIDLWYQALKQSIDDEIYMYPHIADKKAIDFAICWASPKGVFREFPNLKLISSGGAGVNHIIKDPSLPKGIPIVRVVDQKLSRDMAHYIIHAVLDYVRLKKRFDQSQKDKFWDPLPPYNITDKTIVGIMGIGQIGGYILKALNEIEIPTIGFSNSKKDFDGIETFEQHEFHQFLSKSNILICTLPLTEHTHHIINKDLIKHLPKSAYIINIGRGQHLNDNDLLNAINSGHLSGAKLDVFNEEPLPPEHPFWSHPQIEITPHNAAVSDPLNAVHAVVDNYKRFKNNQPLNYQVNIDKGY
ncbi:glyoxylate/hydroxypyruvate reductase A [Thiotrichales bacterium 19S9-12]|nr:glyoxylate/hydroxypyruvate reductase A [Thiotrichales bacterium 19S9-11]MCF6811923.1 glyoxylate/hydroxypyruvate reductase A [Thiotrichales bacterium 19S9-12]